MTSDDRRYGAILADPPWRFETRSPKGVTQRSAARKYAVETIAALAAMPMADYAAKDCRLFMWVIDSHLHQGIELMEKWGFTYSTIAFAWVKTVKDACPTCGLKKPRWTMGYATRKGMEICLLGVRGKLHRLHADVPQVIMAPIREPHRKPDKVYDHIERLVGGPYAEAFARQRWPGWDQILSNEPDKFLTEMKAAE